MKKRIATSLLAFVMAFSLCPSAAFAATGGSSSSGGALATAGLEAARTGNVAKIGDTAYGSLKEAVNAADNGQTVTLLQDTIIIGPRTDSNPWGGNVWIKKNITLDLNKCKVTSDYECAICIDEGVTATVKNGTLTGGSVSTVYMSAGAMNLTLENVTVASADGHGGIWDYGTNSTLTLNSCNVSGDYFAVYHNGSTAPFTLNATGSTITKIGTVIPEACTIYVSGSKENTAGGNKNSINLTGCTVTGPTGIEGKFTDMVLADCDIEGTADQPTFEQFNNGSTALGFAVVSTDNTMQPDSPAPEAVITISGGTYRGLVGLSQLEGIGDYEGFKEAAYRIAGGAFSVDPTGDYTGGVEYAKGADNLYRCAHSGTGRSVSGAYPATCGADGYTGNVVCDFCEQVVSRGSTISATGEHAYGAWTVTEEATEAGPGSQERTCVECGTTEIEEIPALGHTPSAAWQSDASDHWKVCEGCGAELDRAPHAFGEWVVTREATELEPGEKVRSCDVCGATETEELPALGHTPSAAWSSNATDHWKVCEGCGAELERAAHAFGEWKVTKEATTEAAGSQERTCSVCGYVQAQETPRLSPVPEGGSGWVETDDGTWGYVDAGEVVDEGWKEVGGEWYYFEDAAMQTGWAQVGGDWYYLEESGKMDTGWKEVGGEWYYLEDTGKMATGWQKDGDSWYYLNGAGEGTEGSMATGWKAVEGEWYYLEKSGAMKTGWKKTGGKWYYLAGSGAMRSGWQKVGGAWYLLNAGGSGTFGAMLEGWQRVDASTGKPTSANSWYYLNPGSGAMAASRWVGGYYVDASGRWVR